MRALRLSHIVPEFLWKLIYDEKHRAMSWEVMTDSSRTIQIGLRERLLCEACERHLNEAYEFSTCRAWRNRLLPAVQGLRPGEIRWVEGLDYATFKLFHLSILFRAAVATTSEFAHVTLPESELEALRQMLRDRRPGLDDWFPIVASAVVDEAGRSIPHVLPPLAFERFARPEFVFVFGGFEWAYFLTRVAIPEIRDIHLSNSGRLPVVGTRLRDLHSTRAIRNRMARPPTGPE